MLEGGIDRQWKDLRMHGTERRSLILAKKLSETTWTQPSGCVLQLSMDGFEVPSTRIGE